MLTSPPFPESFFPTDNVLIVNCSVSWSSGGLNSIVCAFRKTFPPFPELLSKEKELESRDSVLISRPACRKIVPPFPELLSQA